MIEIKITLSELYISSSIKSDFSLLENRMEDKKLNKFLLKKQYLQRNIRNQLKVRNSMHISSVQIG